MTPMSRVRVVYEGDATAARVELVTVGDDGAEISVADIPANQLMLFVDRNRPGSSSLVLRIDAQYVTMTGDGKVNDLARQRMQYLASLPPDRPRASADEVTAKLCKAHHVPLDECTFGCGVASTAVDTRPPPRSMPGPPDIAGSKKKKR